MAVFWTYSPPPSAYIHLLSATRLTVITLHHFLDHFLSSVAAASTFLCFKPSLRSIRILPAFERFTMPVIRKPLRERCNVQLNVFTEISTEQYYDGQVYDDDVFSRVKRRRPVPDVRVPFNGVVAGKKSPFIPRLHPVTVSTARRLQALHELLPYLFISFHTGNQLPAEIIANDGTTFTHIIKITHATATRKAGTVDIKRDAKRGLFSLALVVPTSSSSSHRRGRRRVKSTKGERNTTVLTEYQLLVARDFLSLALPYFSEMRPNDDITGPVPSADQVRVLVTAPAGDGAAADIMSVVVCYIAFVSGESAQFVLECIEKEEEVHGLWKGVIGEGEDGIQLIDYAAVLGE